MPLRPTLVLAACMALPAAAPAQQHGGGPVPWEEVARLPHPPADAHLAYGPDTLQFGELRLPLGPGPYPVAVVLHGGCWQNAYDLRHLDAFSAALTRAGIATWTLEYRRLGDAGGGWPGTFDDVARGVDHLRALAPRYGLDLARVVAVGHSAGGHLALWLAARRRLPPASPLAAADPLPLRGVVALAAISDLAAYHTGPRDCNASVAPLLGGPPDAVPARYAEASPIALLPLGVPQRLLHGALDPIVPLDQSRAYAARARERGDDARVEVIEGAGHFDLITPLAPAWAAVERAVRALLGEEGEE